MKVCEHYPSVYTHNPESHSLTINLKCCGCGEELWPTAWVLYSDIPEFCDHPKEKVSYKLLVLNSQTPDESTDSWWQCECGARVEPESFKGINEKTNKG